MSVLDDDSVRGLMRQAWQESYPGTSTAREEGGFILRNPDGAILIERWPRGEQDQIRVPSHSGGRRGNLPIVATFHTHPNSGPAFQQQPSLTDIRAVRDDPDLGHPEFEGEYVISAELIYRVVKEGKFEVVGETSRIIDRPSPS